MITLNPFFAFHMMVLNCLFEGYSIKHIMIFGVHLIRSMFGQISFSSVISYTCQIHILVYCKVVRYLLTIPQIFLHLIVKNLFSFKGFGTLSIEMKKIVFKNFKNNLEN